MKNNKKYLMRQFREDTKGKIENGTASGGIQLPACSANKGERLQLEKLKKKIH